MGDSSPEGDRALPHVEEAAEDRPQGEAEEKEPCRRLAGRDRLCRGHRAPDQPVPAAGLPDPLAVHGALPARGRQDLRQQAGLRARADPGHAEDARIPLPVPGRRDHLREPRVHLQRPAQGHPPAGHLHGHPVDRGHRQGRERPAQASFPDQAGSRDAGRQAAHAAGQCRVPDPRRVGLEVRGAAQEGAGLHLSQHPQPGSGRVSRTTRPRASATRWSWRTSPRARSRRKPSPGTLS